MNAARRPAMQAELDALEARMGELAALLAEMADALTCYPESIRIVETVADNVNDGSDAVMLVRAREWPSIQEIEQLVSNWRRLREMVDRS